LPIIIHYIESQNRIDARQLGCKTSLVQTVRTIGAYESAGKIYADKIIQLGEEKEFGDDCDISEIDLVQLYISLNNISRSKAAFFRDEYFDDDFATEAMLRIAALKNAYVRKKEQQ
jgi:hypothetical protein